MAMLFSPKKACDVIGHRFSTVASKAGTLTSPNSLEQPNSVGNNFFLPKTNDSEPQFICNQEY